MKITDTIRPAYVQREAYTIAGFLDYLRWLCEEDDAGEVHTALQIWQLYEGFIREGRYPSEVTRDLGLPDNPEW